MKRELNPELYDWFQYHWKRDNHKKYQSYFESWIENITEGQIFYFEKQMEGEKTKHNIQQDK